MTQEPPVEELLPADEKPTVSAYLDQYIRLVKQRLKVTSEVNFF